MNALQRYILKHYEDTPDLRRYLREGVIKIDRIAEKIMATKTKGVCHEFAGLKGSDISYIDGTESEVKCWTSQVKGTSEAVTVKNLTAKQGKRLLVVIHARLNDILYLIDIPAGIWEDKIRPKWNRGEISFSFSNKKEPWWINFCSILEPSLDKSGQAVFSPKYFEIVKKLTPETSRKVWRSDERIFIDQYGLTLTKQEAFKLVNEHNQLVHHCKKEEWNALIE